MTVVPEFDDLVPLETLIWYDASVLFTAKDAAGVLYLAAAVALANRVETFLYAPISESRLRCSSTHVCRCVRRSPRRTVRVLLVVCDHSGRGLIARVSIAATPIDDVLLPVDGATL